MEQDVDTTKSLVVQSSEGTVFSGQTFDRLIEGARSSYRQPEREPESKPELEPKPEKLTAEKRIMEQKDRLQPQKTRPQQEIFAKQDALSEIRQESLSEFTKHISFANSLAQVSVQQPRQVRLPAIFGDLLRGLRGGRVGGIGFITKKATQEFEASARQIVPMFNISYLVSRFRKIASKLIREYLNARPDKIKDYLTPECYFKLSLQAEAIKKFNLIYFCSRVLAKRIALAHASSLQVKDVDNKEKILPYAVFQFRIRFRLFVMDLQTRQVIMRYRRQFIHAKGTAHVVVNEKGQFMLHDVDIVNKWIRRGLNLLSVITFDAPDPIKFPGLFKSDKPNQPSQSSQSNSSSNQNNTQ
jgi:hypothetical protein